MKETTYPDIVVRTERGLTIAGTRITLYSVMDYIKADWPPKLIRDIYDLTDQQISGVLAYIDANREKVESEYQIVLRKAEENRRYWMDYNREHLERVAAKPHKPEHAEIWAGLRAWQAKLDAA